MNFNIVNTETKDTTSVVNTVFANLIKDVINQDQFAMLLFAVAITDLSEDNRKLLFEKYTDIEKTSDSMRLFYQTVITLASK